MRSLIEERKSYLGPKCFGRAIREQVLPPTLSNVTKMVEKYSGTANPETWLSDYVSPATYMKVVPTLQCVFCP